ncbi:hypothetical protein BaRGS_00017519, partial [Batillaria attramentaria]
RDRSTPPPSTVTSQPRRQARCQRKGDRKKVVRSHFEFGHTYIEAVRSWIGTDENKDIRAWTYILIPLKPFTDVSLFLTLLKPFTDV